MEQTYHVGLLQRGRTRFRFEEPKQMTENESGIARQLLAEAVEVMPDHELAHIYMRWRMNWLCFAHLRHCRALRPNYCPWMRGLPFKGHNRHDKNRVRRCRGSN